MATLTVEQLIGITTRNFTRPLRLRDVCKAYNTNTLSVLSTIRALENNPVIAYVQVRDPAVLTSATHLDELRNAWNSSAPSKDTLNALAAELGQAGAAMVYLSHDWRTVGISGNVGSLSTIRVYVVTLSDVATAGGLITGGAIGAGQIVMGLGAAGAEFTAFGLIGAFGGLFAAGVAIGLGIGILLYSGGDAPVVVDRLDPIVVEVGDTPPDVDASNPPTTPIQISDEPPPVCPDAPPICPGF